MIWRLVHLKLQQDRVDDFLAIFSQVKADIELQPGCLSLVLLRDNDDPSAFATWSGWRDHADLLEYRRSPFFAGFWPRVRQLLREPALAISYHEVGVDEVPSPL